MDFSHNYISEVIDALVYSNLVDAKLYYFNFSHNRINALRGLKLLEKKECKYIIDFS